MAGPKRAAVMPGAACVLPRERDALDEQGVSGLLAGGAFAPLSSSPSYPYFLHFLSFLLFLSLALSVILYLKLVCFSLLPCFRPHTSTNI